MGQAMNQSAVGHVPEPRVFVAARSEEHCAGRIQLGVIDRFGVLERRQIRSCCDVPDDGVFVGAGAEEMPAVTAPTQIANNELMSPWNMPGNGTGRTVPNSD